MIRTCLLLIAATAAAAPAYAQSGSAPTVNRAELLAEIEANFKSLDSDSDGIVTKPEIEAGQRRMLAEASAGVRKKLAEEFAKLDTNKDGMLNVDEFTATAPGLQPEASAGARLDRFDANNDGKITLSEVRDPVLGNFDELDANKDGILTATEQQQQTAAHR